MRIIKVFVSGCRKAAAIWKGILVIWFTQLMLVSVVVIPARNVMENGFGKSMITEKLAGGLNFDAIGDLGATLQNITYFVTSGVLILTFLNLFLNAFFTGGLFDSLKTTDEKFSKIRFFRSAAKNFWPFLWITLIVNLIILMLFLFTVILPVSLVSQSDTTSDKTVFLTGVISVVFFLLVTIMLFLVTDYARVWQVGNEKSACFKALGFGFTYTFKRFLASYPVILVITVVQIFYLWLVFIISGYLKPESGSGVLLLFLLTQILFIIKITLKTWRYGCVTVMARE